MKLKGLIDEDFVNYKKASMFLIFPHCTFKCDKELGEKWCQNSSVAKLPNIEISVEDIVKRYLENPINKAIVCGGLEPFEDFKDLYNLLKEFRKYSQDPFIIYTGFYEAEIADKVGKLTQFPNIIIKYGRFKPNQKPHKDKLLGVSLVNDEQYAKKVS